MTAIAVPSVTAPFRGLASFGENEIDGLLFFGREREIEIVVANLLASRLTVLYGPSGVGKTSLLRAGVARRIRELAGNRAIGRGADAAIVVFSSWPGDPVGALEDAIAGEVRAVAGEHAAEPPRTTSLADAVDHWSTVLDGEIFIVLDQLEELFVYHDAGSAPGTLLAELPEVIVRPRLRAHVLLSLRDDALAELDAFGGALPNLFANVVRLDRLDRTAASAAILGPVQQFNNLVPEDRRVQIDPQLVTDVLDQARTADDPRTIEPPYLQLVMERLWNVEAERGSNRLRASTLAELGGAGEIVREHLDRALAMLSSDERDIADRIFEHLVTPSGTKISHLATDLAQFARATPAVVDPTLATLEHERILRRVDQDGDRRYEIFHDVLAGAILSWRNRRTLERERQTVRRHQHRLVTLGFAALVAVLVMAGITIYALTQRSAARAQERSAQSRALVAGALNELNRDPELSLVLARRAATLNSSELVWAALRDSLLSSRVRRIVPLGAPGTQAAFQADGRTAVALTSTGRVIVADGGSGQIVRIFTLNAPRGLIDPTGSRVLAFGLKHTPTLYTVATGASTRLRTRPVTGAVFSNDGDRLVTMDTGRLAHVWDTSSGRLLQVLKADHTPLVAAVSSDDATVVVGGGQEARTIETFSIATGAPSERHVIGSVVTRLAFAPTGHLLAVAGADRTVTLLDPRRGAHSVVLRGHVGAITSIAFNPSATGVVSANTDGTARVWTTSGDLVTILTGHGLDVISAQFSPDGSRVVTASRDGTARVWDASEGATVAVLAGHDAELTSAAFSSDGRSVATTSSDGTMRLWYAVAEPTLAVVRREPWAVSAARFADGHLVVSPRGSPDVAVSSDGKLFATAMSEEVLVRRSTTGAPVASIRVPTPITGVALAPDDRSVAAAGSDGVARVYRLDGSLMRRFGGSGAPLTRIAFNPTGTLLAAGSTDRAARIWNVSTGRLTVLHGDGDIVLSARFSPDGTKLVTAGRDHLVRIRDVSTGRILHVLRAHFGPVADAGFSPDGRWVVTAGPGKAGLFDAQSGRLVLYLQGHEGALTSASFARDGRTIVTSGVDGTVRTYRCALCVGFSGLEALADARLRLTHRKLTRPEQHELLP
jgi:WD40 repeat protein